MDYSERLAAFSRGGLFKELQQMNGHSGQERIATGEKHIKTLNVIGHCLFDM